MALYQGDNTRAFGGNFLKVNARFKDSEGNYVEILPEISKVELRSGCWRKTILNPTFPLWINMDEAETEGLQINNTIYMAAWDEYGQKLTCDGEKKFNTNPRRV